MNGTETVYIVDDDEFLQMRLELLIEAYGLQVEGFSTAQAFLNRARPSMRGCLILDQMLPDLKGLELLTGLKEKGVNLTVILMSAHADADMIVAAVAGNVFRFLPKPLEDHDLVEAVLAANQHNREMIEQRQHREWYNRLLSLSETERRILSELATGKGRQALSQELVMATRDVALAFRQALAKMELRSMEELNNFAELLKADSFPKQLPACSDVWDGDLDTVSQAFA